jgi:nicotinate-nucleotide adenylyltransferase
LQNTIAPLRIGLLGGSFNPPHLAHLALATAARQQLALTRVDLMPAGLPWQKAGHLLASPTDRLEMCRIAVEKIDGLGVESCEIDRLGNTYTVDTLNALTAQHPDTLYTLIIGADQANRFDTWHDWQTVLRLCRLAVVARNGVAVSLPKHVQNACEGFDTIDLPPLNLSSSAIRANIAAGKSIQNQVPEAVERYIVKHSLYKTL